MHIDSNYNLEFLFDKNSEGLDHLFPSLEFLIRSLENIDRSLVGAVGYTLEYKRFLKNIGEESFTFSLRVRLFQPRQIALGQDFPSENVLAWMEEGRQVFIDAANKNLPEESGGTHSIEDSLIALVDAHQLKSSIMYKSPDAEVIRVLSEDLINAVQFLGGKVRIH